MVPERMLSIVANAIGNELYADQRDENLEVELDAEQQILVKRIAVRVLNDIYAELGF